MQNKEFKQVNILIPVPLEAVEISGILDEPIVKVVAKKGKLLIAVVRDDEEHDNEKVRLTV